jgi:hypothetical protein
MTEKTFAELLQQRFHRLHPEAGWAVSVDWLERRILLVTGEGSTDALSIIVALKPDWGDRHKAVSVDEAILACERAIEQVRRAR